MSDTKIGTVSQPSSDSLVSKSLDDDIPNPPENDVLDRQLVGVLESMNIPRNKFADMMSQTKEKKWQLVWGQMKAQARHEPSYYVDGLLAHVDAIEKKIKKKSKTRKQPQGFPGSNAFLRSMEISLRTNTLQWVKDFLHGTQPTEGSGGKRSSVTDKRGGLDLLMKYFALIDDEGRATMDDYLCVLCIRALMNNAYGFNSVMAHPDTINQIVMCLCNVNPFSVQLAEDQIARKLRTHILVLELLAAVCLVPQGHSRILAAFNNFQKVMEEKVRFQTLMHLLRSERHNVAVTVACMAFINVVVHCVPDMNYQVALQHEFTQLGILPVLEELHKQDAPDLTEQIEAYQDNFVNVAGLAREAELREQDLEHIDELNNDIKHLHHQILEQEQEHTEVVADLHKAMAETKLELELSEEKFLQEQAKVVQLHEQIKLKEIEVNAAVTQAEKAIESLQNTKEENKILRQNSPLKEKEIHEIRRTTPQDGSSFGFGDLLNTSSTTDDLETPVAPAANAPPPPPPPPMPSLGGGPPSAIPPPPGAPSLGAMQPKRRIKLDVKLPMLNWASIPAHRIKATVFEDLNDDKVIEDIDFTEFKDLFQLQAGGKKARGSQAKQAWETPSKKVGPSSVLEMTRARNLAIAFRRVNPDLDEVVAGINELDVSRVPAEQAELLRSQFVADSEEIELLTTSEKKRKLAQIDEYLLRLSHIPRLKIKLDLCLYLDSYEDALVNIIPQCESIIVATDSLLSSKKLRKLLEVMLAFGNFMNSSRRGGVYGFKLSTFDRLLDTRATRKRDINVMHYVVKATLHKYPEAESFAADLISLEQAHCVSFVTLEADIGVLKKLQKSVEMEMKMPGSENLEVLKKFTQDVQPRIAKATEEFEKAQKLYNKCTTFFGEDPKTEPSAFFMTFMRLCQSFALAKKENEDRKKREEEERKKLALLAEANDSFGELGTQNSVEPRGRASRSGSVSKHQRTEIADGEIDEIISDMKVNAYRRPEQAHRRDKREIGQQDAFSSYAQARPWLK